MTSSASKKIGGEYGKVRATIDVEKLNTYLANLNTGTIQTPLVTIKQFKVRLLMAWVLLLMTSSLVR